MQNEIISEMIYHKFNWISHIYKIKLFLLIVNNHHHHRIYFEYDRSLLYHNNQPSPAQPHECIYGNVLNFIYFLITSLYAFQVKVLIIFVSIDRSSDGCQARPVLGGAETCWKWCSKVRVYILMIISKWCEWYLSIQNFNFNQQYINPLSVSLLYALRYYCHMWIFKYI